MQWTMSWGRSGPMAQRRATCESCGKALACELSLSGCWCAKVDLTDAARARIRAQNELLVPDVPEAVRNRF